MLSIEKVPAPRTAILLSLFPQGRTHCTDCSDQDDLPGIAVTDDYSSMDSADTDVTPQRTRQGRPKN